VTQSYRLNARLSVLALLALLGGLVLAACGGTTTTNGGNPTAAGNTQPTTGPTAAAPGGGTTAVATTGGGATAVPTTGTEMGPTAAATMPQGGGTATTGPAATGTMGNQGNQGQQGTALAPLLAAGSPPANADPNGEATFWLGSDPDNIDPQVESDVTAIDVSSQVFAPLLTLTPDNKVAQNAAESYTLSKGGTVYTFKIRQHTYSDGKPVTAGNFAWAMKRACDPAIEGRYSNILYDISGCQEWREADTTKVSGDALKKLAATLDQSIKALDDRTLQITLKRPANYFPYVMTTWVTYPTRQDSVQQDPKTWWEKPNLYIGNGPFKMTAYTPRQRFVFERNDSYFRGKPGLARMNFAINPEDPAAAITAYKTGELDIAGVATTLYPTVQQQGLENQLIRQEGTCTFYIGMNNGMPPFNNEKVRQAIAAGFNREQYLRQVTNNLGKAYGTFMPPSIPGSQQQTQQTFDLARAKQLLSEAGYPNGQGFPALKLPYSNASGASKARAVHVAQQLKQNLGLNITPEPTDPEKLSNMLYVKANNPPLYILGWCSDYPHPQDWVSLVFANNSVQAPQGWNDPQFNALVNKADRTPTLEQALPLYAQADAYLAQKAPVAFFWVSEDLVLVKPNIKGYLKYPGDPIGITRASEKLYKTK
jgi:oligopeptide transport system substrate-binding protein